MGKFSIPIKYGVAIGAGLIAYFLIISLFGAHTNPIYSLFNGVIMAYGMFEALKHYRLHKGNKFKYQKGFMASLLTGFNATASSSSLIVGILYFSPKSEANFLNNK